MRGCADMTDLVSEAQAREWAVRILDDLRERRFPRLIGTAVQDDKPVILHSDADRQYLYFHKYLHSELILRDELRKRLAGDGWRVAGNATVPNGADPLHYNPSPAASSPATRHPPSATPLDRDQRLALGLALTQNFVVISGGPGTGKTSLGPDMLPV